MTEEEKLLAWERFNATAQVGTAHKQQFLDALDLGTSQIVIQSRYDSPNRWHNWLSTDGHILAIGPECPNQESAEGMRDRISENFGFTTRETDTLRR